MLFRSGDTLLGGSGNDALYTFRTAFVDGGTGDDTLFSIGASSATILGGAGNDSIFGNDSTGSNVFDGGDGNDGIYGGSGNDSMNGGAGDDTFVLYAGRGGADTVNGGAGTDLLYAAGSTLSSIANNHNGSFTINFGSGNTVQATNLEFVQDQAGHVVDLLQVNGVVTFP